MIVSHGRPQTVETVGAPAADPAEALPAKPAGKAGNPRSKAARKGWNTRRRNLEAALALEAARKRLHCTGRAFAQALGYTGTPQSLRSVIYRLERGQREIPEPVARLAVMFDKYGIPQAWDVDGHRREDKPHA